MTEKLAISGGKKVRNQPFPFYKTIDKEEKEAVQQVLDKGILSKFLGAQHPDFYGGPQVKAFESEWLDFFNINHAISVNSATSGLITALGAVGIGPGDEVIVTPYSMCISATAPLFYGAIPIFADIEPEYFCLDPASVEKKITEKTKAILVVDLFGQTYDAGALSELAKKHNLYIIEDASQAPMAKYKDQYAGTLGDIGVFSFNYHKHIHTGEGGMIVTNDSDLAERCRLIRNHAEAAVANQETVIDFTNLIGFNFRMTEIEAAIGRCQLKKLPDLIRKRQTNVKFLGEKLSGILFMKPAPVRPGCEHVYYLHTFVFDEEMAGVSRSSFLEAVKAELSHTQNRESEGVKVCGGYVNPLYNLPLFQKKIAIGPNGFPFNLASESTYEAGLCPVAEKCYTETVFYHDLMHADMAETDLSDVAEAFCKVSRNIEQVKEHESRR